MPPLANRYWKWVYSNIKERKREREKLKTFSFVRFKRNPFYGLLFVVFIYFTLFYTYFFFCFFLYWLFIVGDAFFGINRDGKWERASERNRENAKDLTPLFAHSYIEHKTAATVAAMQRTHGSKNHWIKEIHSIVIYKMNKSKLDQKFCWHGLWTFMKCAMIFTECLLFVGPKSRFRRWGRGGEGLTNGIVKNQTTKISYFLVAITSSYWYA